MSYYFNSKKTNTIYSDSDKIPNAKKIKQAFVYKTNLNPNDTNGTCYSYENFFIKDGSLPYFNPSYGENTEQNLITADMIKTIENIHNGSEGSPIILLKH